MIVAWLTAAVAEFVGHPLPEPPALARLGAATGREFAKLLALVLVAAPVVEELLFRGILFLAPAAIAKRFLPRASRAIVIALALAAAALFAAAHYFRPLAGGAWTFTGFDSAFLALFAFGLLQCRSALEHPTLFHAMIAHALFNAVNVGVYFAMEGFKGL